VTSIHEARAYVGTTPLSGFAQLALLERVRPEGIGTQLLEIGCGALHFAKALLAIHGPDVGYCGLDPNRWLRGIALDHDPILAEMVEDYGAAFSANSDFDGSVFGRTFDVVFSHSVLTHVGHEQLRAFFQGAAAAMWPGGTLVASLNVATVDATIGEDWTYPFGVFIDWHDLNDAAHAAGFRDAIIRPDLRDLYMSWCPDEPHDWLVATYHPLP